MNTNNIKKIITSLFFFMVYLNKTRVSYSKMSWVMNICHNMHQEWKKLFPVL